MYIHNSALLAGIVVLASTASEAARIPRAILSRATTTVDVNDVANKSFDFVIAGGGLAGLAIAARLSEWSNVTVAVIEAGSDQSAVQDRVDMPGKAYLAGLSGSVENDWKYICTDGKSWPRGKILGGSGAINGAFWTRGAKEEYDAWNTLQDGASDNEDWGWEEVQRYIKKSESFTPMPNEDEFSLTHDMAAHGTDGPIKTSYSSYQFPLLKTWVPTFMNMGLPNTRDPASGDNHGVSAVPSTINPGNGSRSDSTDYIKPIARSNLVILTGYQVVRIDWKSTTAGSAIAGGLVFSAGPDEPEYTVKAAKEVILSGGTVGTPQLLQLSGVGPKAIIDSVGIKSVVNLPGVGQNVQDHVSASVYLKSTADPTWFLLKDPAVAEAETAKWKADGTGMWTYLNEFTGYASTADIMGADAAGAWTQKLYGDLGAILAQTKTSTGMDDTVATGVKAQYDVQARLATVSNIGQVELIMTMLGAAAGDIGIQVALQRPFSRGTINIKSLSAFTPPDINANYFGDSHDMDIMLAGLKFIRQAAKTPPLSDSILAEMTPGVDVTTDEGMVEYLRTSGKTEFHPSSSCSMLPLTSGGVVDTKLLVYGTTNVRVVDSSIIPLNVAAHLMATTYGIAEKAADIIKRTHQKIVVPSSSAFSTTTSTGKAPGSTTGSNAEDSNVGASQGMSTGVKIAIGAGIGGAALIVAGILFCLRRSRKSPHTRLAEPPVGYSGIHSPSGGSMLPLAPFAKGGARPDSYASSSTDVLHQGGFNGAPTYYKDHPSPSGSPAPYGSPHRQ